MIQTLTQSQFLQADPDRVWDYFSTPANLNALTPTEMKFQTKGNPGPMYAGQTIAYRIRVAPMIWVNWLTEIRQVVPGLLFIDEQRIGPYSLWYHEHRFEPKDGGVLMHDHVTYTLPLGPLGDIVHALWVKRQLRHVFDYRRAEVEKLFNQG